jgi:pimeloyl-ACP methyl ester carboxylesterase
LPLAERTFFLVREGCRPAERTFFLRSARRGCRWQNERSFLRAAALRVERTFFLPGEANIGAAACILWVLRLGLLGLGLRPDVEGTLMSTFVLVPGAWQGGWAWQPVARRLREAGHDAVTITPPGLGDGDRREGLHLSGAVDALVLEIEKRDLHDVVLVAHSWGGYLVTGAAHRLAERLAGIVLVNAMVPRRGVPVAGENEESGAMMRELIASTPDGSIPALADFLPLLLPDSGEELRALFLDLMQPMPGNYFTEALDVDDVRGLGVPLRYLLDEDDQVLIRPGAEFAGRLGLVPEMVGRGHQNMVTHPDLVAAALLR